MTINLEITSTYTEKKSQHHQVERIGEDLYFLMRGIITTMVVESSLPLSPFPLSLSTLRQHKNTNLNILILVTMVEPLIYI